MVFAVSHNSVYLLPVVTAQDNLGSCEDLEYDCAKRMDVQVLVASQPELLSVVTNDRVRTVALHSMGGIIELSDDRKQVSKLDFLEVL